MAFLSTVKRLLNGSPFNFVCLCSTSTSSSTLPKLYICGLPKKTTKQKLRGVFSQFGEIVEVKVEIDEATGKATGFGSITFSEIEEAQTAQKVMSGKYVF